MDKITFWDDETNEEVSLYVIEETTLCERHYLLVQEELSNEAEGYVFEEVGQDTEEAVYIPVEDDDTLETLAKLFSELLEDTDVSV